MRKLVRDFLVKNNYYYLFELAEQVKKAFFQPEFRPKGHLSCSPGRNDAKDGRMAGVQGDSGLFQGSHYHADCKGGREG